MNHRDEELHRLAFREIWGVPLEGGFDIYFRGELVGWARDLPDPSHQEPGCIALGPDGEGWEARGGDSYHGAQRWEPLMNPRETAEEGIRRWNSLTTGSRG